MLIIECMIFWADIWCSTNPWTEVQSPAHITAAVKQCKIGESLSGWHRRGSDFLPVGNELCLYHMDSRLFKHVHSKDTTITFCSSGSCHNISLLQSNDLPYERVLWDHKTVKKSFSCMDSWNDLGQLFFSESRQLLCHVPQTVPHKQQIIVQMGICVKYQTTNGLKNQLWYVYKWHRWLPGYTWKPLKEKKHWVHKNQTCSSHLGELNEINPIHLQYKVTLGILPCSHLFTPKHRIPEKPRALLDLGWPPHLWPILIGNKIKRDKLGFKESLKMSKSNPTLGLKWIYFEVVHTLCWHQTILTW